MSTNLSTLRSKVRRYIDESTADRWSNSDLDAFINEAVVFVQGQIEQRNKEWFLRVETFTASAGSYQAALPSDIWGNHLRAMYVYPSATVATGVGYKVEPASIEWVLDNASVSGDTGFGYALLAGYLLWSPMLSSNSTFRYVYSMKETQLTGDNSNLGRIADAHADIVAMYAAIIAYETIGADTQWLNVRLERALRQMSTDVQSYDPLTIPQVAVDD